MCLILMTNRDLKFKQGNIGSNLVVYCFPFCGWFDFKYSSEYKWYFQYCEIIGQILLVDAVNIQGTQNISHIFC